MSKDFLSIINARKHMILLCFSLLLCATIAMAQSITVTGVVTDDNGDALPGVNVLVKGTTTGTSTLLDGKYTVTVPSRTSVLVFSFIGFVSAEETVGNRTVINVQLNEESRAIEEVVVIAYGTTKKATLAGSVASMGSEDLLKAPVPNMGNALAGNLPGLSAIQYSGQPGSDDPTLFIRGIGSLDAARSAPLFMVDGVERSFFSLDPNEIENISILKDASATAVFGVRGANGVILVTTKRGQVGKARISASTSVGMQRPTRVIELADSYDFGMLYNEAMRNDGTLEEALPFKQHHLDAFRTGSDPLLYPNTDWVKMFIRPASMQTQHNINIQGGTEKVKYFTSIGALTQEGIFKSYNTDYNANFLFQRYNYRTNLDIDVTSNTTLRINLGSRVEMRHEPNVWTDGGTGDFTSMYSALRWAVPFASYGLYEGKHVRGSQYNLPFSDGNLSNGNMFDKIYGRGYADRMDNTLNMDLQLTQKLDVITKGLSVSVKGSYNASFRHNKSRSHSEPIYTAHRDEKGQLFFRKEGSVGAWGFSESSSASRNWYMEASLNYQRKFGAHNVSALALYNQERNPYPGGTYPGIPRGFVGYVGRVQYDYISRYIVDVNAGINGSENFAPGYRYGFLPSGAVAWIISEEKFMKSAPFINYLKLKVSYGIVGNHQIPGGGRFFYLPDAYNPSNGVYNFGTILPNNASQPMATELRLGNKFVSWEKARKQNYAIEFAFFNSQLSGELNYFRERRSDILTSRNTLPTFIAVSMPVVNIGIVENKGYEVDLRWSKKKGTFRYTISPNIGYTVNKVVYRDEIPRNYEWRQETGRRVGQQFGYVFDGFATAERIASGKLPDQKMVLRPGDVLYKDLNDDGVIDDDDVMYIGHTENPQLTGGLRVQFEYKKFDFSMMWVGAAMVSRFLSGDLRTPFGGTRNRTLLQMFVDDRWTPETAETAKYPRMTFNYVTNNFNTNSTLWLMDNSYLRLKNMQIGYTFRGMPWLKKFGISDLRMYTTGENLLTFDYLKFLDPEQQRGGEVNYPLMQVFNLGMNIRF